MDARNDIGHPPNPLTQAKGGGDHRPSFPSEFKTPRIIRIISPSWQSWFTTPLDSGFRRNDVMDAWNDVASIAIDHQRGRVITKSRLWCFGVRCEKRDDQSKNQRWHRSTTSPSNLPSSSQVHACCSNRHHPECHLATSSIPVPMPPRSQGRRSSLRTPNLTSSRESPLIYPTRPLKIITKPVTMPTSPTNMNTGPIRELKVSISMLPSFVRQSSRPTLVP